MILVLASHRSHGDSTGAGSPATAAWVLVFGRLRIVKRVIMMPLGMWASCGGSGVGAQLGGATALERCWSCGG